MGRKRVFPKGTDQKEQYPTEKSVQHKGNPSLIQKQKLSRCFCGNSQEPDLFGASSFPSLLLRDPRGSLSLEAAIAITCFLLLFLSFSCFFAALRADLRMHHVMTEQAKQAAMIPYFENRLHALLAEPEAEGKLQGREKGLLALLEESDWTASMALAGYAQAGLNRAFSENSGKLLTDFQAAGSVYDRDSGQGRLTGQFQFRIPCFPISTVIHIRETLYFRSYLGRDMREGGTERMVYVTKTGTVYHTNPECSYLKVKLKKVPRGETDRLRNQNGARYRPCKRCGSSVLIVSDWIYVTDYGEVYHLDPSCKSIERDVLTVPVTQVTHMRMCSKCRMTGESGS